MIELAGSTLVVACDSAGAIGQKPLDRLIVPEEMVGRMIAAVPLMEVLASGATPVALINTLSVEMQPTGISIIKGIEQAVEEAGLPLPAINGSTEENMPTEQTGLGITVIGSASTGDLRLGTSKAGDLVCCVGKPLVGKEVLELSGQAAGIRAVRTLLDLSVIHEILPVGSKGIEYELGQLANLSGLDYKLLDTAKTLNLDKSAGPATCLLVSIEEGSQDVLNNFTIPVTPLATLV